MAIGDIRDLEDNEKALALEVIDCLTLGRLTILTLRHFERTWPAARAELARRERLEAE